MKVHIERGQAVPEQPGLVVTSPTGDYSPLDLVECGPADRLGLSTCSYQAQYIQYGGVAYRDQEYLELLKSRGLVEVEEKTLDDMLRADGAKVVGEPGTTDAPLDVAPPPSEPQAVPEPPPDPAPAPAPKPKPLPEVVVPTQVETEVSAAADAPPVSVSKLVEDQPVPEVQLEP